jgi:hypothetical protein
MKIPDDLRRTISDVTDKVLERGQQLGKEAQLQVQLKKLQVEHARKIHELGKKTYDWYRSGTMIVSGPVPTDVVDICAQLDSTQAQMTATQREMEEARRVAASTPVAQPQASSTLAPPDTPAPNSAISGAPALNAPQSTQSQSTPGATQPLNDTTNA